MHTGEGSAFCPADGRIALTVKLDRSVRLLGAHSVAQREHLVQRRTGKAHQVTPVGLDAHFSERVLYAFRYALGRVEDRAVKVE